MFLGAQLPSGTTISGWLVSRRCCAQELMLHQQEIERRVSQRWGDVSAAGASWAGQYLPTVEVRAPCPGSRLEFFSCDRRHIFNLQVLCRWYS